MAYSPSNAGSAPPTQSAEFSRPFYLAAWRWHFYAGLYVAPFMIMLAVTGLMMMYLAVFDGRDGEKIIVQIPQSGEQLSIAEQSQQALASIPGGNLVEWIKAPADNGASVFRIAANDVHVMVAVNPYTGEVLESWNRRDGWYDFFSDIHGTLLLGVTGDRMIEIAASLGFILVVTGCYLWWPRGEKGSTTFAPNLSERGRNLWKSLHMTIGLYTSLILVVFLLSGLAWAGVWGEKFVQAWSTFPAEKWDNIPLSDDTHASMNHGAIKDTPWALEQTPMPASGSDAGAPGLETGKPITVDAIAAFAGKLGYEGRFRIAFPSGPTSVWTINQDTMSNDAVNPTSDRTVHIDQHTGRILADVGFADYSLAGKAMAVGIAFHEGDIGLWNLVLNTLFCFAVIFLSVSGIVMWWMRRPKKSALRLFAPKAPANRPHWRSAMLIMLVLSLAFPLVGITLVVALALDILVLSRIPMLKRVYG